MEGTATPLPQWQSHKKVYGDEIVRITIRPLGEPLVKDDTFVDWHLACGGIIHVSHELRHRGGGQDGNPVGGYYVQYEDGFESWSPKEAFESAWTENYQKALHFSRRDDAERFCAEDEDAYFIRFVPYDITDNTGFFNELSPAEAERLWLLVEEMGEALQAIGKVGRHGYASRHPDGGPTNLLNLEKELGHVHRIITMMVAADDISWIRLLNESVSKVVSMKPYLHHQAQAKGS